MVFKIGNSAKDPGPFVETRILNTDECGIASVGADLCGNLFYRRSWCLRGSSYGIAKVIFLRSKNYRGREWRSACEADFDIYLEDGTVIEVNTCNRRIIEAATKYAPRKDVRAAYRRARGR